MKAQDYSLLLCTNGAPEGRPALHYGVWLAGQLQLPVTLLGIVEEGAQEPVVRQVLEATAGELEATDVPYSTRVRPGRARHVIVAEAVPKEHLVVLGSMGRSPLRRWLRGRAFRRMMSDLPVPFIYTATAHRRLRRILVSTGALDHAASAECWGVDLARRVGAALTVLHVVEPVRFDYPTAERLAAHWQDLLTTDTPQARRLRALLERAEAEGVDAELEVRHGSVMHEIVAQARAEPYDLIVMGSRYSSHSLRSQYLPDVAARVLETLSRPVLVVRAGQWCALAARGPGDCRF